MGNEYGQQQGWSGYSNYKTGFDCAHVNCLRQQNIPHRGMYQDTQRMVGQGMGYAQDQIKYALIAHVGQRSQVQPIMQPQPVILPLQARMSQYHDL